MLFRKAETKINKWIESNDVALLVTGARQVGKTFLIRECLKNSKYDILEINFLKSPELVESFNYSISQNAQNLIQLFSIISSKPLKKKETIIFIDEVQECKEILTAIKFLVEDGSYKYVLSGSLLGVELVNLKSAPVGYLHTIQMYPLDFEEFLIANKLHTSFIDELRTCFNNRTRVNDFLHSKIIDAFHRYLIVGGMPKAVSTYVETNDFVETSIVHNDIINQYRNDFSKYENDKSKKLQLKKVYDLIPSEINKPNKRYVYNHLDKNIKYDRYENNFNWLIDAGVAIPVYNVSEPKTPLLINKKDNLFKFFLSDVGLLTTMYGNATILKLLQNSNEINYGAVYENFIAQELYCHNIKPYYYNNKKNGEIDFIIEYMGNINLFEIKSGKNYKVHSALNNLFNIRDYNIDSAYVFSNYNLEKNDKITYLPIYMIMFFEENTSFLPKPSPLELDKLGKLK